MRRASCTGCAHGDPAARARYPDSARFAPADGLARLAQASMYRRSFRAESAVDVKTPPLDDRSMQFRIRRSFGEDNTKTVFFQQEEE